MSWQQGGAPGQGVPPPGDQESTQVGMPVPPPPPGMLRSDVPPGYGQPLPPGYGTPPPGYPPPGYGYAAPPPRRRGISPLLVGLLVLLLVVGLGVGGMYVAHIGPFAVAGGPQPTLISRASSSPSPSPATATATPTLPATTAPATAPAPTPPPTTQPPTTQPPTVPPTGPPTTQAPGGADEELLRSHVPELIVDSCTTSSAAEPALASLLCTANDSSIVVSYTLYADTTSMETAYEANRAIFAPDAGSDTCATSANWPSEYEYTVGGTPSGRVFCADLATTPEMYWTDTRFNILTWALFSGDGTREDMYAFWRDDSGPY
jgi:hypothetical protein